MSMHLFEDLFGSRIPRKGTARNLGILGSIAALAAMKHEEDCRVAFESPNVVSKGDEEQVKRSNGMREFIINGVSIWALNYKNAVRKYAKMK